MILDELLTLIRFSFVGASELDKANRGYLDLRTRISDLIQVVGELGDKIIEPLKSVMNLGHEAFITSLRLGVAADKIQELQFAARATGVSSEGLTHALEHLARSSYEASQGHQEQAKAFGALGISIHDGTGKLKTADVLFTEMADKIAKIQDPAKATALAMQVMGRAGGELVPLLKAGSEGLREFAKEAREANWVMSPETVGRANRLYTTFELVNARVEGLSRRLGAGLLPIAQRVVDTMTLWQKANQAWLNDKIDRVVAGVTDATVQFVKVLWDVVDVARYAWRDLDAIAQTLGGWEPILEVIGAALVGKFTIGLAQAAWSLATFAVTSLAAEAPLILLGVALAAVGVAAFAVYQDLNDAHSVLKKLENTGERPDDLPIIKMLRLVNDLLGTAKLTADQVFGDEDAPWKIAKSGGMWDPGSWTTFNGTSDRETYNSEKERATRYAAMGLAPDGVTYLRDGSRERYESNYEISHPSKLPDSPIASFWRNDASVINSPAGAGSWSGLQHDQDRMPGWGIWAPPTSAGQLVGPGRDIAVIVNQTFMGPPADAAGVREAGRDAGKEVATQLNRAIPQ